MEIEVILSSLHDTRRIGRRLAQSLPHDAVCLLSGDLAAGKTTLIKAICEGMGVNPNLVISPTYTIANWYQGDLLICHVDLYRLESIDDLYNLDADDWLNPEGPTFIEWPELALPLLEGVDTIELAITASRDGDGEERQLTVYSEGDHYRAVFDALSSWRVDDTTATGQWSEEA
jgi:tRNA threonylcarbamoyladenosine biosynthesis protein TsaE